MLITARGRDVIAKDVRVQFGPSLYNKNDPCITIDFFGQRRGKNGCATFSGGSKNVCKHLRFIADEIEKHIAK